MNYSYHLKNNIDSFKEDPKTSTIFGTMLAFPDTIIWELIYNSLYNKSDLPENVGKLKYYEFWPHWDHKGTSNTIYVEPDLFLSFEHLDIIIEAKRHDKGGQNYKEWDNELRAYHNEYTTSTRPPILLAIGGLDDTQNEVREIEDFGKHHVYKCSWLQILINVYTMKEHLLSKQEHNLVRLCDTLILGFNMHNEQYFKWMDSMPFASISLHSICAIQKFFENIHSQPNQFEQISCNKIQDNSLQIINSFFNGK